MTNANEYQHKVHRVHQKCRGLCNCCYDITSTESIHYIKNKITLKKEFQLLKQEKDAKIREQQKLKERFLRNKRG